MANKQSRVPVKNNMSPLRIIGFRPKRSERPPTKNKLIQYPIKFADNKVSIQNGDRANSFWIIGKLGTKMSNSIPVKRSRMMTAQMSAVFE